MLEVIEPGLLTTVQDGGRPGAVDLGVPIGGACDAWCLAVTNGLLGNPQTAAGLEMTLLGATFGVLADCVVGLAGADMEASLDGMPLGVGRSVRLRPGQELAFGAVRPGSGVRTYLSLTGGIDVPVVLGSRSTCLVGGFGGFDGRPLRARDVIRPRERRLPPARRWPAAEAARPPGTVPLRVLAGPDADLLGADAFAALVAADWTVGGRGDRQGIQLEGPRLAVAGGEELLSRGVAWGTVQLPPDGQPILLLADHQTVGGYLVVGVVISADLPLAGQLGPGDGLRFVATDIGAAQTALRTQAAEYATALARLH